MANDFYRFSRMEVGGYRLDITGKIFPSEPWWAAEEGVVCTGAAEFCQQIASIDGEKLTVVIDSSGGDWSAGVRMYEELSNRKGETSCYVIRAYSAATLPLAAVSKGNRVISPLGTVLIHSPRAGADGTADDHDKAAAYLRTLERATVSAYKLASGKTEDELTALMKQETSWTAQEAVDNGFADRISKPGEMASMGAEILRAYMEATKEATATMLHAAVKAEEEARERAEIIRALESIELRK